MARLADPSLIARLDLGECGCPTAPHERDEATVRIRRGASALGRIGAQQVRSVAELDPLAAHRQLLEETLLSWNLVWRDPSEDPPGEGEEDERPIVPVPINRMTIAELDEDTIRGLARQINDRMVTSAPKASGGRSRRSSSAKGSRRPSSRRKRTT